MKKAWAVAAALVILSPAAAEPPRRTQTVHFATGHSVKTYRAKITGFEVDDYVVAARAGQTMTVTLKTDNPSSYFNILAPGAGTALFTGSVDGKRFSGRLPKNGHYVVRVYLMRNAARRNETANYAAAIGVSSLRPPAASPAPPAAGPALSPAKTDGFCRNQAAKRYATAPAHVKLKPGVSAPGGGLWIDGNVGKARFRCRFDARWRFVDIAPIGRP